MNVGEEQTADEEIALTAGWCPAGHDTWGQPAGDSGALWLLFVVVGFLPRCLWLSGSVVLAEGTSPSSPALRSPCGTRWSVRDAHGHAQCPCGRAGAPAEHVTAGCPDLCPPASPHLEGLGD